MGRGFAGGLPCQVPSEGDQPFASSPSAHPIPQGRRRASGDLFSGSLKKKPGAGSLPPGYRHPLHRGVLGLLPKHHPTRFSCLSNWTKVQPVRKSLLPAFYRRTQTPREHHQIACKALGFRCTSEYERLALLHAIHEELARTGDRTRLLRFVWQWIPLTTTRVLRRKDWIRL